MAVKTKLDLQTIHANKNLAARRYWDERLANCTFSNFFEQGPAAAHTGARKNFKRYFHKTGEPVAEALQKIAPSEKARHVIVLAAMAATIRKLTGVGDLVIYTPVYLAEKELYPSGSLLPLRIQVSSEMDFRELAGLVKDNLLNDTRYANYPVEKMLNVTGEALSTVPAIGLMMRDLHSASAFRNLLPDLLFTFSTGEQFTFDIKYETGRYNQVFVRYIADIFVKVLSGVLASPAARIAALDVLEEKEQQRLLYAFNDTRVLYPAENTVVSLFNEQAAANAGAVAMVHDTRTSTYNDLKHTAAKVAAFLQHEYAIKRGDTVAVQLNRSEALVALLLGILKTGAAFIPVDTAYPDARVNAMLHDAGCRLLITENPVAIQPQPHTMAIAQLEKIWPVIQGYPPTAVCAQPMPGDVAYIIYTSGSTGKPKGVAITHQALANYLQWAAGYYIKDTSTGFALFTSIAFDLTLTSIFLPLVTGNTIVVFGEEDKQTLVERVFTSEQVNMIKLTPTHLKLVTGNEAIATAMANTTKKLIVGGEQLETAVARAAYDHCCGHLEIYNEYGPTEATIGCMIHRFSPAGKTSAVPIGLPIANTLVYLLNNNRVPVPVGIQGEIYIAGAGLASGYLHNEALTAERFVSNPFVPGTRMYKTGDLAVRQPDGIILYQGRADEQVKIRGFRIEPGEIEQQLLAEPGVQAAVVTTCTMGDEKNLVAYYVAEKEIAGLRAALEVKLPAHMVPAFFIRINSLPLTVNGKLDKQALPAPVIETDEIVEPANETETLLRSIWAQALKTNEHLISTRKTFFELGGNSLRAIVLANKIYQELGVKLTLKEFFNHENIVALSAYIQQSERTAYSFIKKAPAKPYYPVSSAQRRLYFIHALNPGSLAYNMPYAMQLTGQLNKEKMKEALNRLVNRHEGLRTFFEMAEQQPVQRIVNDVEFEIEHFLAQGNEQECIRAFIRPFDLSVCPLLRVALIEQLPEKHILVVDMHHIISDGISQGVMIREFMDLYEGREPEPLLLQYKDYAWWQNGQAHRAMLEKQRSFWLNEFADKPQPLELPLDFRRPAQKTYNGSSVRFTLNEATTAGLKALAAQQGATMFMVMLALYNILLARLSSQPDVVVGTSAAGRSRNELSGILGVFVNMLTLRNYPEPSLAFTAFLQQVKNRAMNCFEHQDYQYEQLIEDLRVERNTSRNPLFDTMFDYQNFEAESFSLPGIEIAPYESGHAISKFDITFTVYELQNRLHASMEFCTDLFRHSTIETFADYFKRIAGAVVQQPEIRLGEIPLLSAEKNNELLTAYNQTAKPLSATDTVVSLFCKQAREHPNRLAWQSGAYKYTYAELNEKSDRIARWLQVQQGIQPGYKVALALERDELLAPWILGVLKAGAAYVPVDVQYPPERKLHIIKDAGAVCVVSRAALIEDVVKEQTTFIDASHVAAEIEHTSLNGWQHAAAPGLPAYIIYTSGSTGSPKGVVVAHRSLLNYCTWAVQQYVGGETSAVFALFTSISFDLTITSFFVPLIGGHTIQAWRNDEKGMVVEKIFSDKEIHVIKLTPSHLKILLHSGGGVLEKGRMPRKLVVGGEQLDAVLARAIYDKLDGYVEIYNEYGPTEATVGCMTWLYRPEENEYDVVPIGVPIANTQVYLLDSLLQPVPEGVAGEMFIGGEGLATGYHNQPELTAHKFINSPFVSGKKIYRTGDMAVRYANGIMLYKGRADEQVKIRGYRIEPGEIETRLVQHPDIREAVVLALLRGEEKHLAAYYVSSKELENSYLRSWLAQQVPDYMVPQYFVHMESMPLTSNGKVNKKVLPDPELALQGDYVAPANETEEKLAQIWGEVLRLEPAKISTVKSFFELGGNSLKAIELVNRTLKELEIEITLDDVFEYTDIRSLAALVQKLERSTYYAIAKAPEKEYYALSSTQKSMYFINQYDKESLAYNMPMVMKMEGELQRERLLGAFEKIVERHEIFRTRFIMVNNEPVMAIDKHSSLKIDTYNVKENEVRGIVEGLIRPFNLAAAPLIRVALLQTGATEHFLMVDMHHIIMDGTSLGTLVNELVTFYKGEDLPGLKLQYKDFTEWQQSPDRQAQLQEMKDFWVKEFAGGVPTLELPVDFPRPAIKLHEGKTIDFMLNAPEAYALNLLGEREGATLYMVLLSMFSILLAKLSGQDDIVVGTSVASRKHADLKSMPGLFLDTLPLRQQYRTGTSYKSYLREVKIKSLRCFDNQAFQYEELADELQLQRNVSHNAFFDVMFMVQNYERSELKIPGLTLKPYSRIGVESKFDLTLTATEEQGQVLLSFEYSTRLFREETIVKWIGYFRNIIASVTADPNIKLGQIEIISAEEKQQQLTQFNTPAGNDVPISNIVQRFHEAAAQHPGAAAITSGNDTITYRELSEQVNRLAGYLQHTCTLQPGSVAGVYGIRSAEAITAMLAIMQCGAAYAPIDPAYPPERIKQVVADAGMQYLLSPAADDKIEGTGATVVLLNEIRHTPPETGPGEAGTVISENDTAYIIYTSGSTGEPKGIKIGHGALADYAEGFCQYFGITGADVVLQQSSLSFDVSVEEIYPALISGAHIVVLPGGALDIPAMVQAIQHKKVTVVSATPLVINELNKQAAEVNGLRIVISGGELLLPGYIGNLVKQCSVYNTYGPTETTVCATYHRVEDPLQAAIIGRPIRNRQVLIISQQGGLCPVHVRGEIFIAGTGLARGYLNDDKLTKRKFVPVTQLAGRRMFKTGDAGRWLPDGRIEFLGRIDTQVKIRGFRIEPDEVQVRLSAHPAVRACAVLAVGAGDGDKHLVAYFVPREPVTDNEIRQYLQVHLPDYMVPSFFVEMEELPITATGKLNTKLLPAPDVTKNRVYVAPSGEVEEKLAEIWAQVLAMPVQMISAHDNFFYIGGHSIKAMQLVNKVQEAWGAVVTLKDCFAKPTIGQMAEHIEINRWLNRDQAGNDKEKIQIFV